MSTTYDGGHRRRLPSWRGLLFVFGAVAGAVGLWIASDTTPSLVLGLVAGLVLRSVGRRALRALERASRRAYRRAYRTVDRTAAGQASRQVPTE